MKRRLFSLCLAGMLLLSLGVGATAAELPVMAPSGLLVQADGSLLIADSYHRALWRQSADGTRTRLAGREGVRDVDGQPLGGYNDGAAAQTAFQAPWAIAPYRDGYAVTDTGNNVVRYFADGKVTTLAGTGKAGFVNGAGTKASFDGPTGLATGGDGSLYVADTGNNAIRKVDAKGNVTTYAGTGEGAFAADFLEPTGLCYSGGELYVADSGNDKICRIDASGLVFVIAGSKNTEDDSDSYWDGAARSALFSHPQGIAVSGDTVYVADTGNGAIRMIRGDVVSTLLRSGEGPGGLSPISPRAMAVSGNTLYVGDVFAKTILTLNITGFTDVPAGAWYASAVAEVSARGLLRGVTADRFAPAGGLNRGMLAVLLSRMDALVHPNEVISGQSAFPDVAANSYCAAAVSWAVDQGLMTAENGKFFPDRAVTRMEWVSGLYQLGKHVGMSDPPESALLKNYRDHAGIPAAAESAMRWGVASGVLQGTKDGRLMPAAPITRAQAAVMLQRALLPLGLAL